MFRIYHYLIIFALLLLFAGCLPLRCTRESVCSDSDNFNPFIGGAVTYNGVLTPDRCIDSMKLVEFTCSLSAPQGTVVECAYGCGLDEKGYGMCLPRNETKPSRMPPNFSFDVAPPCIDYDGGALSYAPGFVTFRNVTTVDSCLPNGSVSEFVCINGTVRKLVMECLRGCRVNYQGFGACKPTAGGSPRQLIFEGPGGSNGGGNGNDGDDVIIPEFGVLATGLALSLAGFLIFLLRKK